MGVLIYVFSDIRGATEPSLKARLFPEVGWGVSSSPGSSTSQLYVWGPLFSLPESPFPDLSNRVGWGSGKDPMRAGRASARHIVGVQEMNVDSCSSSPSGNFHVESRASVWKRKEGWDWQMVRVL